MSEISIPPPQLPSILRADLAGPRIERRSWVWTIAPAYAGVFAWEPFFDRLGKFLVGESSLGPLIAVSLLAAIACFGLLYLVPALSGWAAGERLSLVGASTFGTAGSEWIAGVAVGVGAIGFYAVSIFMAVRLTLLGLIASGGVASSALDPVSLGPLVLDPPVLLLSALFWIFITIAANGLRLTGVIVALMQVYTPVALLLLAATALLSCSGQAASTAAVTAPSTAAGPAGQGTSGGLELFQLVFAYFAFSGFAAVDWGMAVRHRRDLRIGGWLGVILAGSYCASLSLVTVAGAARRIGPGSIDEAGLRLADPRTFHGAIFHGIGGITGGTILMLFGLASLAPAVYAVFVYSTRLASHWPAIGRRGWVWLGAGIGFVLVSTSRACQIDTIFGLIGAVFASAVGAMTGDWLRRRGIWRGGRAGVNPAGVSAWGAGVMVGQIPILGGSIGWRIASFQPAALFAYLTALAFYLVLAALGLESSETHIPGLVEHKTAAVPSVVGADGDAHGAGTSLSPERTTRAREAGPGPGTT
jgi:cytosine permease